MSIQRAEFSPGNDYRYVVLATPFTGLLEAAVLGGVTNGTLIVECFTGRAYLFSSNSISNFVSVCYVEEKFKLTGEHVHAVAALIAKLLGRETDSKYAGKLIDVCAL